LSRPQGDVQFFFVYIPLCIKWKHCAAFGGYSSTVVQKEISRKKKFFYTLTFVAGSLRSPFFAQTSGFFKKKSTTCSSFFQFLFFSVPCRHSCFSLLCLYASLFDRECNKCCRYHISHLACHSQNIGVQQQLTLRCILSAYF
jgi:hypothetical protein